VNEQRIVCNFCPYTGRLHFHGGTLYGNVERELIGANDLDRVHLLVDRRLDHFGQQAAAHPSRAVERYIQHVNGSDQPFVLPVVFEVDVGLRVS